MGWRKMGTRGDGEEEEMEMEGERGEREARVSDRGSNAECE